MFRSVASKACLIAFAIAGSAASIPACSSDGNGSGGAGASPGGASGFAGLGGSSTAGAAGLSIAGASSSGPFNCAKGNIANCDTWSTFSHATTTSWGSSVFQGGVTTFGANLTRDPASSAIHVSGTVDNYGYGFGLFFLNCSDLSAYTGVSFKLSGTAGSANMMIFQVQTNPDYPWEAMPSDRKGGCTAAVASDPFGTCVAPSITLPIADQSVPFTDLMGGKPLATASPDQALGLQWALPYDGKTSYMFDVTVSEVKLIGGTGVSCNPPSTGAGGAGGAGGASGAGGAESAGAAGSGGSSAGSAGSSAGSGGSSAGSAGSGGSAGSTSGNGGTAGSP
ncbi:MAG TPA: hypothetical protein VGF76_24505 [Polyangiaceae bacterium]